MREVVLYKGPVRGTMFRCAEERTVASSVVLGRLLDLVPEPTNEHDKHAVKVVLGSGSGQFHLGYIPKGISEPIGALLAERTLAVACRVVSSGPGVMGLNDWDSPAAPELDVEVCLELP